MFARTFVRRSNSCFTFQSFRKFASSSEAYSAYVNRCSNLAKSYPGLFDEKLFESSKQALISDVQSAQESLLSQYNSARLKVDSLSEGEQIYLEYTAQNLPSIEDVSLAHTNLSQDDIKQRFDQGGNLTSQLQSLLNTDGLSSEQKNLRMVELCDLADKLEHWKSHVPSDLNFNEDFGLPINDEQLDAWVKTQYYRAPEEVRVQGLKSAEELIKVEEDWLAQLDEKLVHKLKSEISNFDEAKWRTFNEKCNEMFHPHNIDHYSFLNWSKYLFRAALYDSDERLQNVEHSLRLVKKALTDNASNEVEIIRKMYETDANMKNAKFVAKQLSMTDPLFAAKLVADVKGYYMETIFARSVKDIVRDVELPFLREEQKEVQEEIENRQMENPVVFKQRIKALQKEIDAFEIEAKSLDEFLDEYLVKKLWQRDASKVKQVLRKYAQGKCKDLRSVRNAVEECLQASFDESELQGFERDDVMKLVAKYHSAMISNERWLGLKDLLRMCAEKKDEEEKLRCKSALLSRLRDLGVDDLVVVLALNLVRSNETKEIERVIEEYFELVKRYRGEIDALIVSARELSSQELGIIEKSLQQCNPNKKIQVKTQVSPTIGAGFVVKAGVKKLDFSLATHIYESRKAIQ